MDPLQTFSYIAQQYCYSAHSCVELLLTFFITYRPHVMNTGPDLIHYHIVSSSYHDCILKIQNCVTIYAHAIMENLLKI